MDRTQEQPGERDVQGKIWGERAWHSHALFRDTHSSPSAKSLPSQKLSKPHHWEVFMEASLYRHDWWNHRPLVVNSISRPTFPPRGWELESLKLPTRSWMFWRPAPILKLSMGPIGLASLVQLMFPSSWSLRNFPGFQELCAKNQNKG